MTVELKPETEQLVQEELRNGYFGSVDEMIVQGIRARHDRKPQPELKRKTRAEAVRHIRELRHGNRLPAGVTIKDFINEGRA